MKARSSVKQYKILSVYPHLSPYINDISLRMQRHADTRKLLLGDKADLSSFANGYLYYGFHRTASGWVFREWAPGADDLHLIGDFNNWNPESHPMTRLEGGTWEVHLEGTDAPAHLQRVKLLVTKGGNRFERIPSYIRCTTKGDDDHGYAGLIWNPSHPFRWTDGGYGKRRAVPLYIYEAHIGSAQEREGIGSYREFADNNLARIRSLGYNAVKLHAVMEHPDYSSAGNSVTCFFAASNHFGTPDDLKYLMNKAHELGLYVLLDVVHAQASAEEGAGLCRFDGTEDQFFMPGEYGTHPVSGEKLFNYGKHEVIHFLLSNLKFWLEEYHFDGFHFSGVTSMIYQDHALNTNFDDAGQYFGLNINVDAVSYLQLANELIHAVNPFATTVADDTSNMPGICIPIRSGGIGFDYRLSASIPPLLKKLSLEVPDDQWSMSAIWSGMTTGSAVEKSIGLCENLRLNPGVSSLMFDLAGPEIYSGMAKPYHSFGIDRAIALHKMFRFLTLTLNSEAYQNPMGNEFGHPDRLELPCKANGFSCSMARLQLSLSANSALKYEWLENFDVAMLKFARKHRVLNKSSSKLLKLDEENMLISFARGNLIYLFNFSPDRSPTNVFIPAEFGSGRYMAVFTTDGIDFGGLDRVSMRYVYYATEFEGKGLGFEVYIPNRTAAVFKRLEK